MAWWQTHIPNDSPLNIIESYELFNIPLSSSFIPCNPGWFIFRGSPFLEYSNPQYIEWYNLPTNHQPTGVLNTNSPARRPPAADRRWSKSRCGTELWQRTTVSPQGNQRNGSGICFLGKYRKIICKYESSILTDWVWFKCVWDILRSIIHWDSSKMTFKTIQISEILWSWPRIEPTQCWGVSWRVNAQLEPPANCWKEDHTQCVAQHLIPKLLSNTRHQIHSLA